MTERFEKLCSEPFEDEQKKQVFEKIYGPDGVSRWVVYDVPPSKDEFVMNDKIMKDDYKYNFTKKAIEMRDMIISIIELNKHEFISVDELKSLNISANAHAHMYYFISLCTNCPNFMFDFAYLCKKKNIDNVNVINIVKNTIKIKWH